MFDSVSLMVQAAIDGAGVALAPPALFDRELRARQLVQPFPILADTGAYWLAWLRARELTPAMAALRDWCRAPAFRAPSDV
jgi:LysR family transcriptional regulator of beta-lactamase